CLAWALLAVGIDRVAPRWDDVTLDGDLAYLPDRMTSVRGERLFRRAFPERISKSEMALVIERQDGPLSAADLLAVDALADSFRGIDDLPIVDVWTHKTDVIGQKLVSPVSERGQAALVLLLLRNEFMATDNIRVLDRVRTMLTRFAARPTVPAGLLFGISGPAAVGGDTLASARESIQNTELATVVLVVAILLAVYRAPLLAIVPLVAIAVSVAVALDLVALLVQGCAVLRGWYPDLTWLDFKIFKTTKIFVVVLLFGSGTDFCLFLISRYKEELEHGTERTTALARAMGHVGSAVTASALTTVFGLAMMAFADFGKFRNSGPAIALCLLVTLAACLTLAPAVLRGLGSTVFWPFAVSAASPVRGRPSRGSPWDRLWGRTASAILARPGLILAGSVLVLLPLAWHGVSLKISYDLLADLQPDRPSVQGTAMLHRHFTPGETGPVTLLAVQPHTQFDTREGRRQINQLMQLIYQFPGVASVRSLTEPLGERPRYRSPLTSEGIRAQTIREHPRTKATFVSSVPQIGGVTRLDLVFRTEPFASDSVALLDQIDQRLKQLQHEEASPWRGAEFDFLGTTAGIRDLAAVTRSDQRLIQQLVTLAVLAILVVMLRRPLLCCYLILSVIFSYLVTIGATELLFGAVYGEGFNGLDWKAPIFLFVILVAVGEDYNIYLMSRIFEEQSRHGLLEGLRSAIVRTGGIISSCGVIMAGSFLSMMTGTLRGMLELGFALTLGIVLDTFIVRPVLVPAFLACTYKWNAARGRSAEDDRTLGPGESPAVVIGSGSN
ncbi:MAG: MMPL family transporter, partial [Planctomycetes bacterium]|nr:MMPL family transporter [Planctomycetota bacterium]